jgi:hypothetical protein
MSVPRNGVRRRDIATSAVWLVFRFYPVSPQKKKGKLPTCIPFCEEQVIIGFKTFFR